MLRVSILQNSKLKIHHLGRPLSTKLAKHFEPYVPDRLKPFWNHPAGLQTIFFWAPAIKWGLVIAGIADLRRHPSTMSPKQTLSLAITGFLWCRYSMVIIPKNYLLFSVNFFIGVTQCFQLYRIFKYKKNCAVLKK